ncbi:phospholipase D-like domain-containing protein [Haloarcula onubensis]|uniref:Phospholipase D-like domain-containing protein n=1 Tax=Haloarcula onubensis TaxID=2950539 RepID=A0ABU2FRX0_9EURY|nr:phospholipase D-like domain-containing protein [Halomicroarcula sp. S3CR25-11]MDS0283001.1 phospholipase D-like domain-containing protein [Halomicroarcula sp. S3CR25-11]
MRLRRVLLAVLVCCGAVTAGFVGPLPAAAGTTGSVDRPTTASAGELGSQAAGRTAGEPRSRPTIHAIYPDPVRSGDRGEFVVLAVPNGTDLGRYTVSDGDTSAPLANRTVSGRVAVTDAPESVRNLTDYPVVGLDSAPSLANGGDSVALRRNGTTVASVRYSDTEEGELGIVAGSTLRWRPVGATDRPVVTGGAGAVRAFTLPDAPQAPLAPIRNASERVYLAGYTLSSARVADALVAAQRRGATVRVLLEGEPVGGRTRAEARTLDRLQGAGVAVRVVAGPRARYRYHHAKYAVADERAVVLTENWKPAGTGGRSSRGWGVGTAQSRVVDGLAATFRADAGWRDAVAWDDYREGRSFQRGESANGSYPSKFDATTVPVERTELLVTPDNAQGALVAELDAAEESIDVVQPTVGGWDEPLMRALRRAAKRGVEVRLLLSSAWYVSEENQRTVERFESWAERTGAPLSAKLADPGDRYAKIHAKGAVVDGDRVILGSLNWNEQAATSNREVVLVLYGSAVADYFGRVFERDWAGGKPSVPLGVAAAVGGALVVAGLAARRVRFAT